MSFSKTAIKTIKRMTKNQLIDMVIKISNYAEETKAKNIILLEMYKETQKQQNKESESK